MLAFLHLPKTGGTSLRASFEASGRKVFSLDSTEDAVRFLGMPREVRQQYDVVFGHMPWGIHKVVPEVTMYATFLREPVDRVISAYYHVARDPYHPVHGDLVNGLSLEAFADLPWVRNDQVKYLSLRVDWSDISRGLWPAEYTDADICVERALYRTGQMRFVGIFERYAREVRRMSAAIGYKGLKPVHEMQGVGRLALTDLKRETAEALAKTTQLDAHVWAVADLAARRSASIGGSRLWSKIFTRRHGR